MVHLINENILKYFLEKYLKLLEIESIIRNKTFKK